MLAYQLSSLLAVATTVGIESNNPEGGMNQDAADNDIIEVVIDIANGEPYKLSVEMDNLTTWQEQRIIAAFLSGAHDR